MGVSRFTNTERSEIEKIYRVGQFSSVAIARQYHCSSQAISRAVKHAGGKMRTIKQAFQLVQEGMPSWGHWGYRFTSAECEEIEKIYRVGGYSAVHIAKQYHCDRHLIGNAVRRVGSRTRTAAEVMALNVAKGKCNRTLLTMGEQRCITAIYVVGKKSSKAIAQVYGCSKQCILGAIRRQGGIVRTTSEALCVRFPNIVHMGGSGGYPGVSISRLTGEAHTLAMKMTPSSRYIKYHRLIMALHLHRPLLPSEIVHHRDGNKANYDISNLELLTQENHGPAWGDPYYHKWQEAETEIRKLKAKLSQLRRKTER